MRVLDVQRRGQQLGRIRIGQQVATSNGRTRPAKLDTFRFTTGSKFAAESIAALYGGQVVPWERGQYEVITTESALFVTIPPRDDIISQSYEMWTGGGCLRRCNSQREQISGGECQCPHAEDPMNEDEVAEAASRRAELAKLNPPKACKLVTRISVMLPDLPGLGVWRLDTHSFYAAVEIGDQADVMTKARQHGVYLRAILRIDQRERVADGQTKHYPVPVLEILDTFRDLVSGAIGSRSIEQQLPPAPGRLALPAGTTQIAAPEQPADEPTVTAQDLADQAKSTTSLVKLKHLAEQGESLGVADDLITTDGETYEGLRDYLRDRYRTVAAGRRRPQEQATADPDDPGPAVPGSQDTLGWPA